MDVLHEVTGQYRKGTDGARFLKHIKKDVPILCSRWSFFKTVIKKNMSNFIDFAPEKAEINFVFLMKMLSPDMHKRVLQCTKDDVKATKE